MKDKRMVKITIENRGDGDMVRVKGNLTVDGLVMTEYPVYFGRVPAGGRISRKVALTQQSDVYDILEISVNFMEINNVVIPSAQIQK